MPKWRKDAKKFVVAINYDDLRGNQCNIPKPVLEFLGNPDKIMFVMTGKNVRVKSAS